MSLHADPQREQIDDIITATLQTGLDDWISLGDVQAAALYYGAPLVPAPGGDRAVAADYLIPVITHLSENRLVRIGSVYPQGFFVPHEGTDDEALAWMTQIYRDQDKVWDWLAWMELTSTGKALAESLPAAAYHLPENE
ncbi:hypothetical protein JS562_54660, partial [Agrobacterium sp. S2]|nr:hypothetical protein [Agrobacterium sp. S2]